jgi:carbamoyltransferase
MYKVLTKFEQLTSIPALINTSFNVHEEPIVYTTNDALRAFESGKVDALVINNFLVLPPLT